MAIKTHQRGETVVLSESIRDSAGALHSPSVSITVTVTSPTGEVVVNALAMTEDSTGLYHYDYALAADAAYGTYNVLCTMVDGSPARTTLKESAFVCDAEIPVRSNVAFDYGWSIEDRDDIHLSRWRLQHIATRSEHNLDADGRLWLKLAYSSPNASGGLYSERACTTQVATIANTDVSTLTTAPIKVTITEANTSGITGEFYLEEWETPAAIEGIEVLVALCVDDDLSDERDDLDTLPAYDETAGMARWISAACTRVMLDVYNIHADALGGYGAPEHRNILTADRDYPDPRRISNPDQLRRIVALRSLSLAMGASHQRAGDTLYSVERDRYDAMADEAMSRLRLVINTDPDNDGDADERASSQVVQIVRM